MPALVSWAMICYTQLQVAVLSSSSYAAARRHPRLSTEAVPYFMRRSHPVTYTDQTLTCNDCGKEFAFTAGEQEFHASKGFTNKPGRCPDCRAARRSERQGGSYGSSGGSYGGPREMFSATCASCGKEARVPFEPRGDRPVYCSDCFRSQQGSGGGRGGYSSGGNRW
jgi:CxxC-x17-CxxC domain-containing protein